MERENLMLLLKDCDKNDLSEQTQAALTHIADGVCHALKIRIETILNGCTDIIILYSVSNLIRFYQTILKQVICSTGVVVVVVVVAIINLCPLVDHKGR